VVFGGDGTILRGAELARPAGVPLLGVNLGHVGFLAEADLDQMEVTVQHVLERTYHVEERLTIDVTVWTDGSVEFSTWALNDASVEKASRQRVLEAVVEVDGRPVSGSGATGWCSRRLPGRPPTTSRPAGPSCGRRCRRC
jgi:NAD+ kinase